MPTWTYDSDWQCTEEWKSDQDDQIEDPILASLVKELGGYTECVLLSYRANKVDENVESVLCVCGTTQHMRLHVGNLSRMELAARETTKELMQLAVDSMVGLEVVSDEQKKSFENAKTNIADRLDKINHDDPALEPLTHNERTH